MNTRKFRLLTACLLAANTSLSAQSLHEVVEALRSDDSIKINTQLTAVEKANPEQKDAYLGALTMKKSGLVKGGMEKLSMFKKGKVLLEGAVRHDSLNAEYRFLRLLIQEHVPDFLNYHKKKEEDAQLIRASFGKLSPGLKEAIRSYSKNSKVLKPEDFQN